jgi:hypothetical protein
MMPGPSKLTRVGEKAKCLKTPKSKSSPHASSRTFATRCINPELTGRGYGVSAERARQVITRLESIGGNLDRMQTELENLAFVM